MGEWVRRHSPLVLMAGAGVVASALALVVGHPLVTSVAGNCLGIAVLLAVFDVTPSGTQEKEEQGGG